MGGLLLTEEDYCSICADKAQKDHEELMAEVKAHEEQIKHPKHYTVGGIEVLDIMKSKMSTGHFQGYLRGNIIKYILRAGHKGDAKAELLDLEKAEFYLQRLIRELRQ